MFEAGRKNTFTERTIRQFGYEFREKVWTVLMMERGIQSAEEALAGQDVRFFCGSQWHWTEKCF